MLRRLLEHLSYRHRFRVLRVIARDLRLPSAPHPPQGVAIRWLDAAELRAHCVDGSLEMPLEPSLRALERGDQCTAAFDGDRVVGYVWSATTRAPDVDGLWLDVPANAIYRYKAFVRPEWRGRGIVAMLYHFDNGAFLARDRYLSLGYVAAENSASLSAAARSGATSLGTVVMYAPQPGPFLVWHSAGVRAAGLRFTRPA
jgi:GNAT superfamily N-acetyltransferase